jgi:hypothetical protein
MPAQNIENYDTYDAEEKDKTMKTGTAVNKNKIKNFLSKMCKIYGRIKIRNWIGIEMLGGSGSTSNDADPQHWYTNF